MEEEKKRKRRDKREGRNVEICLMCSGIRSTLKISE